MAPETAAQQRKVSKVMHEFKQGKLKGGAGKHPKVKSRKQAIAIALSEAGVAKKNPAPKRPSRTRRATGKASNIAR